MSEPSPKLIFQYAVYCAWCHKVVSYTTVENSSGICDDCAHKMRAKMPKKAAAAAGAKGEHKQEIKNS